MTSKAFIDVHILQSVPPSCINRDDTGSPKSAAYGGVRRARVSSQAWKRATRLRFSDELDEKELGVRTRRVVDLVVEEIGRLRDTLSAEDRERLAVAVVSATGLKLEKSRRGDHQKSEYLVLVSRQQAATLASIAVDLLDEEDEALDSAISRIEKARKEAKAALAMGNSVDLALFGRMVANDTDLNVDASCQVAHAISVHAAETEFDYFTAMDDIRGEAAEGEGQDAGAGMIGTVEFNSATLYRYATIDVGELYRNLGDNEEATRRGIEAFLRAFVLSMPSGKVNTFANNTLPDGVVITLRGDQPVSWVGAFETPVRPGQAGGYTKAAAEAMIEWARSIEEAYGVSAVQAWSFGIGATGDRLADVAPGTSFASLPGEVSASAVARAVGER